MQSMLAPCLRAIHAQAGSGRMSHLMKCGISHSTSLIKKSAQCADLSFKELRVYQVKLQAERQEKDLQ